MGFTAESYRYFSVLKSGSPLVRELDSLVKDVGNECAMKAKVTSSSLSNTSVVSTVEQKVDKIMNAPRIEARIQLVRYALVRMNFVAITRLSGSGRVLILIVGDEIC